MKDGKNNVWKTIDKGYTKVACKSKLVTLIRKIFNKKELQEELAETKRKFIKERAKNVISSDYYWGNNGRTIIRQDNQL